VLQLPLLSPPPTRARCTHCSLQPVTRRSVPDSPHLRTRPAAPPVTVTAPRPYTPLTSPRIHITLTPSPDTLRRINTDDTKMSTPYELRNTDNGKSKKQSMAELKLRRLTELNQRLQEDLNRRRIPVSEAAMEYADINPSFA
jgi:hypothetical protein